MATATARRQLTSSRMHTAAEDLALERSVSARFHGIKNAKFRYGSGKCGCAGIGKTDSQCSEESDAGAVSCFERSSSMHRIIVVRIAALCLQFLPLRRNLPFVNVWLSAE